MSTHKTKLRLTDELDALPKINGKVLKIRSGDNKDPLFGTIFVWQETKKHAEEQLKKAWASAVSEGLIKDDDTLREAGEDDEHILNESNGFTVVAKVSKAKQLFSRDKFIETVARRFHLDRGRLDAIANDCCVESKPSLSKRVLEA